MQTVDDVITALQANAGTLTDSTAILCDGEGARVFDANGNTVGKWSVQ